jgi:hypothetical protein
VTDGGHPYGSTRASHPGSLAPDCSKVSTCCRFNLRNSPKPARGRRGLVGLARLANDPPRKKILHVRVLPQQKFPRRALNLRNVVHVSTSFSHMQARCRDKRRVGLELSSAFRNCCNARAGRFDVSS